MSTRSALFLFVAFAFAPAVRAQSAADPHHRPTAAQIVSAAPGVPLTLSALFQTSAEVTVLADGTAVVAAPVQSMLVAHRAADGTLTITCVATPEAAARLLTPSADSKRPADSSSEEK